MRAFQRTCLALLTASTLALAACSGGHSPLPTSRETLVASTLDHGRNAEGDHGSAMRFVSELELDVHGATASFALPEHAHCKRGRHPEDEERDAYVGHGERLDVPAFTFANPCMHRDEDREDDDEDGGRSSAHAYYVVGVTLDGGTPFAITGPATISAATLAFAASNAPLVLASRAEYAFFLVDASSVLATPTPPPPKAFAWCASNATTTARAAIPAAAGPATQTQAPSGMLTYVANTTSIRGGQRIICGPNGNLYVLSSGGVKSFSPATNTFASIYAQTVVAGAGIAADAAGKLYVAQYTGKGAASIVQLAADGSGAQQIAVPTSYVGSVPTFDLTEGTDGNAYGSAFDATNAAAILHIGTQISAQVLPTGCASNASLFPGTDAALWISATCGWTKMSASGAFSIVAPNATPIGPAHLGPDGKLYGAAQGALTVLDPSTGSLGTYPLPAEAAYPQIPVAGADGNLWFSALDASNANPILCRLTTATGAMTEYPLASMTNGATIVDVSPATDGNLYAIAGDGILKIAPGLAGK